MMKENGVFHMKTDEDREMEKRVNERKEELMERYRAQQEQREEAKASQHLSETKAQSRSDGVEEYATFMDRRKERNGMEDRVGVSLVNSRLYADQQSASHYGWREETTEATSRFNSGKT